MPIVFSETKERPQPVSYKTRIVRFSLDLDVSQKNFLRMLAAKNEINASVVLRALIYLLQTDVTLVNRVLDLIFSAPEVEAEHLEGEDLDETAPTLEEQEENQPPS